MVLLFVRGRLFCYNTYMKNRVIIPLLLLTLFLLLPQHAAQENSINVLVYQIQESLKAKNIPAYLENFSPGIRKKEELKIRSLFEDFPIENVTFYRARRNTEGLSKGEIYLKVLFENSYFVLIETWQLLFQREKDRWLIKERNLEGESKQLYRIHFPSEKAEKVKTVEIGHADIKIKFKDATIFYDNIPGFETALLVLGNGTLLFTPSDPKERHQLEMLYKKRFLEDRLNYAYLRFSNSFFNKNVKIDRVEDKRKRRISEDEIDKASSLFYSHYSRSFTIENSLNGELLSFLPKGKEAVFEFEGRKIGRFTYVYSPNSVEQVNLYQWKGEKIISLYSPRTDENTGGKQMFLFFSRMFDIRSYHIEIAFEPKEYYLSGKAKIEINPEVRSLDGVKFKFNPELEILRIYDKEKRQLFYTQDKLRKILYVYFFKPLSKDGRTSIEIYYRGKLIPPRQMSDVIAQLQFSDTQAYSTPRYNTYLYSKSAYWYPAPPDDDYFKAHIKIIIPPDYTCISNGELVEKTRLNGLDKVEDLEKIGNYAYVFQTKFPIKYLTFIIGKFKKVQEDSEPLPLQVFESSDPRLQRMKILDQAKEILGFYESKFGLFPFEKLTIVRRLWPTSGGHSPASFIVLNSLPQRLARNSYMSIRSPVDFSRWREYFIAHEIAHQWWGQGVTWMSYHDQWLSEGLAQFSSILYLSEKYGDRVFSSILKKLTRWTEKKSEWGAITMGSRLSYFDYDAYQSIIYNKTSVVLNMLKDFIGEEAFFKGLRKFFADHKYGAASTNDFIRAFNKISDYDLRPFFVAWFDSHTLPWVRVTHSVKKRGEKYLLELTIHQERGLFIFPLWVQWNLNREKVIEKLLIDKKTNKFDFELEVKPRKIKVNMNEAVPGKFY